MRNMTGSAFRGLLPTLALVVAGAFPGASQAMEVRPVLKLGLDFGGEEIASTTDGGSLKTNDGFILGGGTSILSDSKDLEVEVTLAWKYGNLSASDGSISFTRFPLDALVFYRMPQFRLGGGLTYHLNPKLKGDGVASGLDVKFDNAVGLVIQGDYLIGSKMTLGLRYTSLEYKLNSVTAKASGVGVTFGISF
jgi:hypothetical protein